MMLNFQVASCRDRFTSLLLHRLVQPPRRSWSVSTVPPAQLAVNPLGCYCHTLTGLGHRVTLCVHVPA